jgi:GTP cyclohydrolase II
MPLSGFRQIAEVNLPTRWASFRLLAFDAQRIDRPSKHKKVETAVALVLGDLHASPSPVVRIHSQCTTGDAFESLRCDCHDQLHLAMQTIAEAGSGVLVYEYQEGRGIGLMEKLRAYELQDQGLDTIEANLQLGHEIDARDYELPVRILRFLKVRSLRLMTNNPKKIHAVSSSGIEVRERLSANVPLGKHNAHYVATKRMKLGHLSSPVLPLYIPRGDEMQQFLGDKSAAPQSGTLTPGPPAPICRDKRLHNGDSCATTA